MSVVLNFKTEKETKELAQKVARDLGLPLGTIMNHYLREFVRERKVTFASHPLPNSHTRDELDTRLADIREGKNISPAFNDAEKALAWLHS